MVEYNVPDNVDSLSVEGIEFTATDGRIQVTDVSTDVIAGLLRAGCVLAQDAATPDGLAEPVADEKRRLIEALRAAGKDVNGRASIAWLRAQKAALDEDQV